MSPLDLVNAWLAGNLAALTPALDATVSAMLSHSGLPSVVLNGLGILFNLVRGLGRRRPCLALGALAHGVRCTMGLCMLCMFDSYYSLLMLAIVFRS